MILLSQRDIRWSSIKMLPSTLTLGRYGCTTTAICMLSDYFKCFTLPSVAASHNIKYNSEGKILWNTIDFATFKFTQRVYAFDPVRIEDSLKDPDKAVILEVWNMSHWVALVRRSLFGGYVVADPWTGKLITIKKSEVTGSAHFIRK